MASELPPHCCKGAKLKRYKVDAKINMIMDFEGMTEDMKTFLWDLEYWLYTKLKTNRPHSIDIEIIKSEGI